MNYLKSFLLVTCVFFGVRNGMSQDADKATFGLGMGLDYGGFGMNLTFYPASRLGLFGGLGYPLHGVGYNLGAKVRFSTDKPVNFYLTGMYGYNTVVVVVDAKDYNRQFNGTSIGFGLDLGPRDSKSGYFSFGLLVPFRGSEVDNYLDNLRNNYGVDINDPLPVAISVGYRFILSR